MKSVCCYITTYNRPSGVLAVLRDLAREASRNAGTYDIRVRVYDDCSAKDYAAVRQYIKAQGWEYVRAERNHGKRRYWEWLTYIYQDLRKAPAANYYVQLPDDVRLCGRFLTRLISQWSAIRDPKKIALNPLHDRGRSTGTCWTGIPPTRAGDVDRVGWVDLCLLSTRDYFTALKWRVPPISEDRWKGAAGVSSGVGAQISMRLVSSGRTMYRSSRSLVVHRFLGSQMNSEERRHVSMVVKDFVDGPQRAVELAAGGVVSASLASIPSRREALERVVASLLPQVCRLYVYLNGYEDVPQFLGDQQITIARSQDSGDLGDAGKFWWSDRLVDFCLTCDDDLIYPENYAEHLISALWVHSLQAAVGLHGARVVEPVLSYYRSRKVFHCLHDVPEDVGVHILGTGALAYHSSGIQVTPSDFRAPNMADVWFALLGQKQKVPFICLGHRAGWLEHIDHEETIYVTSRRSDAIQTAAVQSQVPWHPNFGSALPPPQVSVPTAAPSRARVTLARPTRRKAQW